MVAYHRLHPHNDINPRSKRYFKRFYSPLIFQWKRYVIFPLGFLFFLLIVSLAKNLFRSDRVGNAPVLSGYVDPTRSSNKDYYASFIKSYDAHPTWYPSQRYGTVDQPLVSAESAVIVDIDSGRILFDKEASKRMKIASVTKIMTAVVAIEHKNVSEDIKVSKYAANIGENSMSLSEGEIYSLKELLYGLMLPSGNDAAYAIAEGTAGSAERFVEWMNLTAQRLGLKDTHFADPSGLDDSTYSTPLDLVKLTRYALNDPTFREIVKTVDIELPYQEDRHKYLHLWNETNLLTSYPGVEGVKIGYTEEAGLCLVTYANNGNTDLVGVVLNSLDRKSDMVLMLDHAYSVLGIPVEHPMIDYL